MIRGPKHMRVLTILLAASAIVSCARERTPSPAAAKPPKTLLMHYMAWYTTPAVRGEWSGHWVGFPPQHHPEQTTTNGLPDIWSNYHPLIGLYDSADPAVLECQLLQMKLAGIDGVIPDWYGIGDTADYPAVHKATCALFDACGRFGMKFAVCYEDRSIQLMVDWKKLDPAQITNHLAQTIQWAQKEWFTKPQYFQYRGRPLFLNFGPIYLTNRAIWDAAFETIPSRPSFYALHHLWRKAGADGGFTWVHRDPWEGTPTEARIRERIQEVFTYFSTNTDEVIVSAYPGFDDVYAQHQPPLDYRGGKTLQETLEVAMAGPWPLIQLITWNDYGEGTMIEPTHEFGYSFLEVIRQTRRNELGPTFTTTANDLGLPARLYALRKRGSVASSRLDAIAELLSKGNCQQARQQLDALDQQRQAQ
jgi:hypothetical protein